MNALPALSTAWTPERIDELREYAAQGLTAAQIAYRMKPFTELAIVGRCARLGIELGVKQPPKPKGRRVQVEVEEGDPMFGVAPPAREDAWNPINGAEPVHLVDALNSQCTWPIGEGSTGMCCGRAKGEKLPYCPEHTALAYEGGRYRRPSAFVRQFIHSASRYR